MRFIVQRDLLIRELDIAKPLFQHNVEMFNCAKVSAENGRFTIRAHDGYRHITTGGEAMVVQEGSVLIKARTLLTLIKELPVGEVTFEKKDGKLLLWADQFEAALVPAVHMLDVKPITPASSIVLKAADIQALAKDVQGILSDHVDLAKVALLIVGETGTRIVATDRSRLALSDIGEADGGQTLFVGKKDLEILLSLLKYHDGDVVIRYETDNTDMTIDAGGRLLQTRQSKIVYPDYSRILPAESETKVLCKPDELTAAARRTVLMLSKPEDAILTMTVSEDKIVVLADGGREQGTASEDVPCRATGVLPFEIRLLAKYLLDSLVVCAGDLVQLEGGAGNRPVKVSSPGRKVSYLVMPIGKPRSAAAA